MERILASLVSIACLTVLGTFTQTVYEVVSADRGRIEGVLYAVCTLIIPLFAVGFLYEYGSTSAETSNLTPFGRVTVAAFVVLIGPLPVLALVTPPDPFTLVRRVGLVLGAATPIAYLLLFRLLSFDIAHGPDEAA